MIDVKKELIEMLEKVGVPIVYEMFVDSKTPIPCISYMMAYDSDSLKGDTLTYSDVSFLIKVYSKDLVELEDICNKVKTNLRDKFTRTNGQEMIIDNILIKNYIFSGTAKDYIK